jgi:uncharacterized membrane protein
MNEPTYRVASIDIVRGLVMAIMALDHARDFFHAEAMISDPLDLATTTAPLFFTRWITHFCAPLFVFLAGCSAFLSGRRRTRSELASFLLKRGIWLIVVELTVVNFGWTFNPFFTTAVFQVIWAIGVSMLILSVFVLLPHHVTGLAGLSILALHNLFDGYTGTFLTQLLHGGGPAVFPLTEHHNLLIIYPLVPWTGIMLCGYWSGTVFTREISPEKRMRILSITGVLLLGVFVLLRSWNQYGDPHPWSAQPDLMLSLLAFLRVEKYPPSLVYACMTIGTGLLLLALTERATGLLARILGIFGKVPFFYYILHIYLIHLVAVVMFFASGYGAADIIPTDAPFFFRPAAMGVGLAWVYVLWIAVLVALYPLCNWFNRFRATHHHPVLRYL